MVTELIELVPVPLERQDVEVALLDLQRLADPESTAAGFLTPPEREEFAGLRHPSRRREWLGARVCLKTMLVRRSCLSDPAQCEVVKDAAGRPRLSFAPGTPPSAVYDCSLSHKARFACACVSDVAGTRVGVDIERVSPRLGRLTGAFVNDRDSLIPTRSPDVRLAVLWSLKEACSKAVGSGVGIGLADVICEETSEGRHHLRVRDGPELRARHFMHDGYVISLCLMKEEALTTRESPGSSDGKRHQMKMQGIRNDKNTY